MLENRICPCNCGQKIADSHVEPDADVPAWDVQTVRCSARASLEVSKRIAIYHAETLPADRDPNHKAYRMHPDDGLISYVVQRAPETEEGEP